MPFYIVEATRLQRVFYIVEADDEDAALEADTNEEDCIGAICEGIENWDVVGDEHTTREEAMDDEVAIACRTQDPIIGIAT